MAKYSPGGILLLGIGAFLVSIGWTDRLTAVWSALITGQRDSAVSGLTPGSPGSSALNPSPRPTSLLSWANGAIYAPGSGDTCPSGFWSVLVKGGKGDGANICVKQGDATIAKWDNGTAGNCDLWDHGVTSSGQPICFQPPPNDDWTMQSNTSQDSGTSPHFSTVGQSAFGGGGQATTDHYILLPTGVYVQKSNPSAQVF